MRFQRLTPLLTSITCLCLSGCLYHFSECMSVKARQGRKQQLELVYKRKRVKRGGEKSVHIYEQVGAVSMHGKV